MIWQDPVLMTCSAFFAVALIPALRAKEKPAIRTSIMTCILLCICGFVDCTLGLWLTAFFTALTALVWGALAEQARRNKRE
jgi:hypothetical protein